MPKYFFDLTAANFILLDHTSGRVLPDDAAAHDRAVENIKAYLRGKPWRGLDPSTSSVEVTDERGKLYLKVPFDEVSGPIARK